MTYCLQHSVELMNPVLPACPSSCAESRTTSPASEYEGIVDTGFSGFIQIPFSEACQLQLPLQGTVTNILADGSVVTALTALGRATIQENGNSLGPAVGTVQISTSSEILVGMEFLRAFGRGLGVFSQTVFLLPDPPANA